MRTPPGDKVNASPARGGHRPHCQCTALAERPRVDTENDHTSYRSLCTHVRLAVRAGVREPWPIPCVASFSHQAKTTLAVVTI